MLVYGDVITIEASAEKARKLVRSMHIYSLIDEYTLSLAGNPCIVIALLDQPFYSMLKNKLNAPLYSTPQRIE